MIEGLLPGLSPDDPKNLLPAAARHRINRAHDHADKIRWEAVALIDSRGIDRDSKQAQFRMNQANLKAARTVLRATWEEFGKLSLPIKEFREYMRGEIEGASNSLELLGSQRRLLEITFCSAPETRHPLAPPQRAGAKTAPESSLALWAACPRIRLDSAGETGTAPRLFATVAAAKRFLSDEQNTAGPIEVEAELLGITAAEVRARRRERRAQTKVVREEHRKKVASGEVSPLALDYQLQVRRNRDAWDGPIRVEGIDAGGGPRSARRFREFLPLSNVGEAPSRSLKRVIELAAASRHPEYSCCLSDEWRFDEIASDIWKREGHVFEGRKHASIEEIAVKAVYDIEDAFYEVHPDASASAVAHFWESWQVWHYVAVFCQQMTNSPSALTFVSDKGSMGRKLHEVHAFLCEQFVAYAYSLTKGSASPFAQTANTSVTTGKPSLTDPRILVEAYLRDFPEAMKMDICWAAKQHYRELKRWLAGRLKPGSKPDRAFRLLLTSGKSPNVCRPEPRPKGWQ
jgi:hypothetical protein